MLSRRTSRTLCSSTQDRRPRRPGCANRPFAGRPIGRHPEDAKTPYRAAQTTKRTTTGRAAAGDPTGAAFPLFQKPQLLPICTRSIKRHEQTEATANGSARPAGTRCDPQGAGIPCRSLFVLPAVIAQIFSRNPCAIAWTRAAIAGSLSHAGGRHAQRKPWTSCRTHRTRNAYNATGGPLPSLAFGHRLRPAWTYTQTAAGVTPGRLASAGRYPPPPGTRKRKNRRTVGGGFSNCAGFLSKGVHGDLFFILIYIIIANRKENTQEV